MAKRNTRLSFRCIDWLGGVLFRLAKHSFQGNLETNLGDVAIPPIEIRLTIIRDAISEIEIDE